MHTQKWTEQWDGQPSAQAGLVLVVSLDALEANPDMTDFTHKYFSACLKTQGL